MVQNIRSAFMDNLQDVKWMDRKTKQAAMEKVTGMISDIFKYPLACEHSLHTIWKSREKSGESRTRKETRV